MNVLVTGGAGYIGSHASLRLLETGNKVLIVDNLDRGNLGAVEALKKISPEQLSFEQCDILERERLLGLMQTHQIDTVMHFAALAYVGESVTEPLRYYRNNTAGALSLIEAASAAGIQRFVFSSTCATYGEPPSDQIPIEETCTQDPVNPYGRSKLMVEHILADHAHEARVNARELC